MQRSATLLLGLLPLLLEGNVVHETRNAIRNVRQRCARNKTIRNAMLYATLRKPSNKCYAIANGSQCGTRNTIRYATLRSYMQSYAVAIVTLF